MRACPYIACCALSLVVCATVLAAAARADQPQDEVGHHRVRRQNGEVVESIFQIPIQTLMAVSKVFTTGIQSIQRTREQFFQATRPSSGSLGTSSLTSSGAGAALQQQYQQYQQYRPQKPYANRPTRPSAGTSSSSAYSSAYAALTRPNYNYVYSGYVYPRGGAAATASASASKSHAARVAGVSTQETAPATASSAARGGAGRSLHD